MLKEFLENLRLLKNRLRIHLLEIFTGRVKRVVIEDPKTGKKHEVVTEKQEEKVCSHKHLEQIVGTFWRCMDCDYAYMEITYKVLLSRSDLIGMLEVMADHLKKPNPLDDAPGE